ncbi:unnamed protein product [Alopecurus aequalis]
MEMVLDWRSVGSLIATVMVLRTAMRNFLPPEAEQWLLRFLARVAAAFRAPTATILIDEADGAAITSVANDLYDAAHIYLGAHIYLPPGRPHHPRHLEGRHATSPTSSPRPPGRSSRRGSTAASGPPTHSPTPPRSTHSPSTRRSARRSVPTCSASRPGGSTTPASAARGSAGPPGTGKTSLVAAIANLLVFDVYDLELTTVATNSHLRRLLVSTTPKSVVVIEDIDCSLDLADRRRKNGGGIVHDEDNNNNGQMAAIGRESISLSGERLDPALLRPGRMDRKIELGYCSPAALRLLAKNYLGVGGEDTDDDTVNGLMAQAEGLLAADVRITPADIGEVFMGCDGAGASAALRKLVGELSRRKSALTAETME